jgi:hypothetical protein
MMKQISIFLILIPSALSAMNGASSAQKKKFIVEFSPVPYHARADQNNHTIRMILENNSTARHFPLNSEKVQSWNARTYRNTELKLLETIPNDETQQFIVLFSLKQSHRETPHFGIAKAKYGTKVPLGDQTDIVQYFLHMPELGDQDKIRPYLPVGYQDNPPFKKEALSDSAQKILAFLEACRESSDTATITKPLSSLTIASNNNNNDNNSQ